MTNEKTFYTDTRVEVTNSRFMMAGQTIAMSGVTAVTTLRHSLSKLEWVALVVGLLCLFGGRDWSTRIILGLLPLAFGVWAWLNSVYTLLLTSSSGKQRVLSDRNKQRIFEIAEAVNSVIVHRS